MTPVLRDGHLPLSYLEKEMLLNHLIYDGSPAGKMNFVCKIRGDINVEALANAFQQATVDIEVFRTRYHVVEGRVVRSQRVPTLEIPRVVQTSNLSSFVHNRVTKPFDLSTEPLGRCLNSHRYTQASHISGGYLARVGVIMLAELNELSLTYIDWAQWAENAQPDSRALFFWSSYLSKQLVQTQAGICLGSLVMISGLL
ncbi:hypothetical protein PRK78_007376 [Emydomyces testavorans]|uniref:Uncharacterized protein n=1 Tax=Emydomyces testavorans TaxID=2070801 RepID=A0AAF0DP58_9EURO|nr:hypothetical protein PRK78_007376 [Emydomyces testavorans]